MTSPTGTVSPAETSSSGWCRRQGRDLDRLVGHDLDHGLVLGHGGADLHHPADDLTLCDTLPDVGQLEVEHLARCRGRSRRGRGGGGGGGRGGCGGRRGRSRRGGGAAAAAGLAPLSRWKITSPTGIVSPSPARSLTTVPAAGAGTSTVALSVMTSTTGWCSSTVAPSATSHWTISPSAMPSPMSGSLNSIIGVSCWIYVRLWGGSGAGDQKSWTASIASSTRRSSGR